MACCSPSLAQPLLRASHRCCPVAAVREASRLPHLCHNGKAPALDLLQNDDLRGRAALREQISLHEQAALHERAALRGLITLRRQIAVHEQAAPAQIAAVAPVRYAALWPIAALLRVHDHCVQA